jgi:hypothetical protein
MAAINLRDDLSVLYWNCCGLGADWDGSSSRKFELLRAGDMYDLIILVETHLAVVADTLPGDEWVFSAPVGTDSSSGVALWVGPRLRSAVRDQGRVGSRVAWIKIETDRGSTFFVGQYIAHMGRSNPSREDCFKVMEKFLRDKVKDQDRLFLALDANSRVSRDNPPVTGHFSVHQFSDDGGVRLHEICSTAGLCAASTFFRPAKSKRGTTVTFIPRGRSEGKKGAQIDFLLVKQRYLSDVNQCRVIWDHSIRHGQRFDHGAIVFSLRLKVKRARSRIPVVDTRPLKEDPVLAAQFDRALNKNLLDKGIDLKCLVPQIRSAAVKSMPRFGPEQRFSDPQITRVLADEFVQLDHAHWGKIAKEALRKVGKLIKNGACAQGQKQKLNLPEYQAIAVRLIALQQSAPKKAKYTHTKTKLKRFENWKGLLGKQ